MLKRIISLVCIMLLLVATLVGCQSTPQPAQQTAADGQPQFDAKEMTIYIRMMEMQDKWFREEIIMPFEREYGVKINVRTFENEMDLENVLKLDEGKNTIGLVKTLSTQLNPLVQKGLIMSLEDAVGSQYEQDIKEYTDVAMDMATIDGKVYYIPRKIETNTMLFLKSKVQDAVNNWNQFEPQINQMFKELNGYGLPEGYVLEADPNRWDWYDLAVVGYYWANTEYNGSKGPKIAHRGHKYEGTTVELVTKIYQAGGTQEDVLAMNADSVRETFEWEVLFKEYGMYNPGMWEESWTGGGIWNAMAAGQVYLAFMHQIDGFFIHGGSNPNMTGYLTDPDDMGLAVMPKGVSLAIENGKPVMEGTKGSQLAGFWWGIPTSTPDAKLSYELARWITNTENHGNESRNFGMMPVRKDILASMGSTFKEVWMQEIFDVANLQAEFGVKPVPQVLQWPEISQQYLEAWYEIVIDGNNADVQKVLDEKYGPKAKEILK